MNNRIYPQAGYVYSSYVPVMIHPTLGSQEIPEGFRNGRLYTLGGHTLMNEEYGNTSSEATTAVEEDTNAVDNTILEDGTYDSIIDDSFDSDILSEVEDALARKDEIVGAAQVEVLNLNALLQNLSWEEFAALPNSQIKVADASRLFDTNETGLLQGSIIDGASLILYNEQRDFVAYRSYPIITTSNTSVSVIVDDDVDTSVRLPVKAVGDIPRGMIISQKYTDKNLGSVSFLPIATGLKKVFGMYNIITPDTDYSIPIYAFFYATSCKSDEMIPSVSHIQVPETFDVNRSLTEIDKVMMSNTSARFKTIAQQCDTVYEALRQINNYMSETIDPNYILKLMLLTQQLVYVNVADEETNDPTEETPVAEATDPTEEGPVLMDPTEG